MAIDHSIPLQAKYTPIKFPNMLEQRARGQEVQLNQMQLQQGQQDQQEKNALRQIISRPGFDPYNQGTQQAMMEAAPGRAPGVIAQLREIQTANADAQKAKRNRAIVEIANFDTPQQALDSLSGYVGKGLSQEQADNMASQIPNDQAGFKNWQVKTLRGMLSPKDQLGDRREQEELQLQREQQAQDMRSAKAAKADPVAMQREMYERAAYESNISVGELVKREDAFTKVNGALDHAQAEIDATVTAIDNLIASPGLGEIAGYIQGGTEKLATSADGQAALSLYNMVMAQGTLRALQGLREVSTNGASGLGIATDNDMILLSDSQASIDRGQGVKNLVANLEVYKAKLIASKARGKNVFNETYNYRNSEAYLNKGGAGGNQSGYTDYNDLK